MSNRTGRALAALLATAAIALPAIAQDQPSVPIAALRLQSAAPQGADLLIGGKADDIAANWLKRYTQDAANWTMDDQGAIVPNPAAKADITSRKSYGDAYIHLEFSPAVGPDGKTIGHGNSGIGLQGRYEIQIMDSYGKPLSIHDCGAMYSQKQPRVNACRKPGEWQSYDILFRAPRVDADGKVTEKARATVFQNGILLFNNEEFVGPTGIQYSEFKGEAATGPIVLQGDHDVVKYRNVWVLPL